MTDGIRFWFRGEVVEVSDVPPTLSVLHWLRESRASIGTKEGCNQGDCGACTIVLAERIGTGGSTAEQPGVRLRTANSCLLLMPMLHGRALFTIEDLATAEGLHPVQQAMVDAAGSPCGFCTPGFVMSMWCPAEKARSSGVAPGRTDLVPALRSSGDHLREGLTSSGPTAWPACPRSRTRGRTWPSARRPGSRMPGARSSSASRT